MVNTLFIEIIKKGIYHRSWRRDMWSTYVYSAENPMRMRFWLAVLHESVAFACSAWPGHSRFICIFILHIGHLFCCYSINILTQKFPKDLYLLRSDFRSGEVGTHYWQRWRRWREEQWGAMVCNCISEPHRKLLFMAARTTNLCALCKKSEKTVNWISSPLSCINQFRVSYLPKADCRMISSKRVIRRNLQPIEPFKPESDAKNTRVH